MTNPCWLAARSATEATAVTLRATSTLGAPPKEHGVSAASGGGPHQGGGAEVAAIEGGEQQCRFFLAE
jgi:hypothetical protein